MFYGVSLAWLLELIPTPPPSSSLSLSPSLSYTESGVATGTDPSPPLLQSKPKPKLNYCPARVAMFGCSVGRAQSEGAVQFARTGPELICHEQGGPLTHPHCGTKFSLSRVCQYLHAKLAQNATQKLLTFL